MSIPAVMGQLAQVRVHVLLALHACSCFGGVGWPGPAGPASLPAASATTCVTRRKAKCRHPTWLLFLLLPQVFIGQIFLVPIFSRKTAAYKAKLKEEAGSLPTATAPANGAGGDGPGSEGAVGTPEVVVANGGTKSTGTAALDQSEAGSKDVEASLKVAADLSASLGTADDSSRDDGSGDSQDQPAARDGAPPGNAPLGKH